MPFIVKATYRNETRRITFTDSHIPPFKDLKDQLSRVFGLRRPYHLSNVYFSQDKSCKLLIGQHIRTLEQYDLYCSPFHGESLNKGCLTFTIVEEAYSGVNSLPDPSRSNGANMLSGAQIPVPDAQTAKPGTPCCNVAEGKKEIKGMIDGFLHNLQVVLGNTFGDENSFFEPFDTPRRNGPPSAPSPLPPLSLDASLHIPGTFMGSRPNTPSVTEDDINVEKNQSPPRLEPYQTLHPGIWCDFCGKQIKGLRFKCQECPHYDLCANCIVVNRALDKHNEDKSMIHRFSTISAPTPEESSVPNVPTPAQATSTNPIQTNPHYVVYCDRCDGRITGRRYKCLNCHDYDLCEGCIEYVYEHDNKHRFLVVHSLSMVNFHTTPAIITPPSEPVATSQAVHLARCDLCESRIVGQRFKCLDCPDFDTCSSCFVITPEQHPGHSFVKIHDQQDYLVRRKPEEIYHFATCNACDKRIIGVRYKCMHPDCPDFDLCQNCEALPFSQHPDTHPMLKLKYGSTFIPPRPKIEQAVQVSQVAQTQLNSSSIKSEPVFDTPMAGTAIATNPEPEPKLSPGDSMPGVPFHQTSSPTMKNIAAEASASHTIDDPKAAEERSRHLVDKEIQELEDARQRKHDDDAARQASSRQDATSFLEEVKATLSGQPFTYKAVLEPLLECFGNSDISVIHELKERMHNTLVEYPNLQQSLENFISNEIPSHSAPGQHMGVHRCPNCDFVAQRASSLEIHRRSHDDAAPYECPICQKRFKTSSNCNRHKGMHQVTNSNATGLTNFMQGVSAIFQTSITPVASSYSATFVSENVPDGHVFPSGTEFIKSWRIRNDGPAWENVEIVFVGGTRLGASGLPNSYPVASLATGEEEDIVVKDMKAPEEPGRYISHWRLRDANLNYFGPAMWCDIISAEADSDGSRHSSLSNSAVIMPGVTHTAEHVNDSVTAAPTTITSTPATVPTSALSTGDSSEVSSVPSGSVLDNSDGEWDDLRDVSASPSHRSGNRDDYQVVYDSDDDI